MESRTGKKRNQRTSGGDGRVQITAVACICTQGLAAAMSPLLFVVLGE